MKGRIISNKANRYQVKEIKSGEIYLSYARGKLKNENILPVVGDIVEFKITDIQKKEAIIEEMYSRDVYIKRPKISNLTQIIFVVSSHNPKPDLLMLDKQITFAEFLKIKIVIVLNKIDLDKEKQFENIKKEYEKIGYKVIETNAKEKKGIEELEKVMRNNINAFSGNSGVGKSTLINALFRKDIAQEGEISLKNKKGKNTTTDIELYEINNNTYIADTPGFSTFDIFEIESTDLEKYFIEFIPEINNCEFVGCTHIKEEICGVKSAVKKGEISKGRYERFCKIYDELVQKEERKW